jgi:hypothetical protein
MTGIRTTADSMRRQHPAVEVAGGCCAPPTGEVMFEEGL